MRTYEMRSPFMKTAWLCLLVGLLGACGTAATYHYSIFELKAVHLQMPVETGAGKPAICEQLFKLPGVYVGPAISIPQTAIPFGVVVVTDGRTSAIVPLFSWTDEKGDKQYGCNGPSPQFARSAKSQEELIRTLGKLFRK
jgi:hypothetical protein